MSLFWDAVTYGWPWTLVPVLAVAVGGFAANYRRGRGRWKNL